VVFRKCTSIFISDSSTIFCGCNQASRYERFKVASIWTKV